jgi:hypothetical protein
MDPFRPDDPATLQQAADRARRLLEHLVHDRDELASFVSRPDLPGLAHLPSPGLLAEGQAALQHAIDAAGRLAEDLGAAADVARPGAFP